MMLSECTSNPTHNGKQVKDLINRWHSSLRAPVGWRVAFTLESAGKIAGISTWGRPTARLEDQVTTLEHTRMALGRRLQTSTLVCNFRAPRNAGSWFLARNREWIRDNMPEIRRLIAYVNECSLMPWHERNYANHKGSIYLADNWKQVYRKKTYTTWSNRAGRLGNEARLRAKFERVP